MCVTERVPVVRTSESKDDEEMIAHNLSPDAVVNLDHGDPTVFETFWRSMGEKCTVVIPGYQSLSYFADAKNLCWFLEPKLEESIKNLHHMVGNAVVEDRHIVVGTGSSQLVQAVLYALSPPDQPEPMTVVCAAPYYSCYKEVTEFLQSGLYKWGGNACTFDKDGPYIEMVTSPNNPDGVCRQAVVNRDGGKLVHDLAYYWPQYTAITAPADYDIMLFTVSKCTGHAGSRIGWAVVKDKEVAKRMIKYIEVNTIGVSKESQHRAAKLLEVITPKNGWVANNFFVYTQNVMANRWEKLRNAINDSPHFSLAKYPLQYCNFTREFAQQVPAFAWIKCKDNTEDCAELFKEHKILTRSGTRFGVDAKFARVSMVSREEEFNLFIERLCAMNKLHAA